MAHRQRLGAGGGRGGHHLLHGGDHRHRLRVRLVRRADLHPGSSAGHAGHWAGCHNHPGACFLHDLHDGLGGRRHRGHIAGRIRRILGDLLPARSAQLQRGPAGRHALRSYHEEARQEERRQMERCRRRRRRLHLHAELCWVPGGAYTHGAAARWRRCDELSHVHGGQRDVPAVLHPQHIRQAGAGRHRRDHAVHRGRRGGAPRLPAALRARARPVVQPDVAGGLELGPDCGEGAGGTRRGGLGAARGRGAGGAALSLVDHLQAPAPPARRRSPLLRDPLAISPCVGKL
mmetsp:Transcript_51457/g.146916  ORF Transcript_51457/g.146916 Transcript_51457/m.146916 type:complete len:289 (-) Transcript_51457:77-943(-)